MTADNTPKMLLFDPPIELLIATRGQIASCTAEGSFLHQGELTGVTIPEIGTLMQFIQAIIEGEASCVLKLNGEVIPVPPWLALHLEGLDKAGRIKLVDMPPVGDSATRTEAP